MFLFFGFAILVLIGLLIGITYLLYIIPKKLGYPKTGKYLSIIFGFFIATIAFMMIFEDRLFTKSDAKKLLAEQDIVLANEFILEHNESSWAIGADYYHTFTLKISKQDRKNAIDKITHSQNFTKLGLPVNEMLFMMTGKESYYGTKKTQNYETESCFVREYFQPSGREGYVPTFRRISISKKENCLVFEDIAE